MAGFFAVLLEAWSSASRNDRPEALVAAARFEAIPPFTGLSAIRTPGTLHVAGHRLVKTKSQFIVDNQLVLFTL
jgi:hypothetical protein